MSDTQDMTPCPEEMGPEGLSAAEAVPSEPPAEEPTPAEEPAFAEEAAAAEASAPAEEAAPAEVFSNTDEAAPLEERAPADAVPPAKPRRHRGLVAYACVMTAFFVATLAMFVAFLWYTYDPTPEEIRRPGVPVGDTGEAIEGVETAKHSVVVIEIKKAGATGTGTGIVMTRDGYIATNHHVIENATEVKVTFYDGRSMMAEVIGSSPMDDLAVIKVTATDLIPATFAYSSECYVGQTVYAIGTPGGAEFAWTTTRGIISYKDREVKIHDDEGNLEKKLRLIQTDANVNPGNSGGPLINERGEVVGVVSMKLSEGYEGIGFAIPSDGALEILEAIREHGNADDIQSSVSHKRPMLGILCVSVEAGKYYLKETDRILEIPEEEVAHYDPDEVIHPAVSGVFVMGITEGMDAVGKIEIGDIITAAEGIDITTGTELTAIVNEYYAGDTITLTVYRGAVYTPVEIILSAKPDETAAETKPEAPAESAPESGN